MLQGQEETDMLMYRRGYKAPYWRAPELHRGEPPSKATDVYAYGMLMYEIMYRREPFEKENIEVRSISALRQLTNNATDHTACCCGDVHVVPALCVYKLLVLFLSLVPWGFSIG